MRTKLIGLDLDDTLYAERQYVEGGLMAAGCWMERTQGISGVGERALELFQAGARGNLFDLALDSLGIGGGKPLVAHLVAAYREHVPALSLFPDAEVFLRQVQGKAKTVLITDGYLEVQRAKIAALGLEARLDLLLPTDAWGREFWKPHERAFLFATAHWGVEPAQAVYIGDNPAKDFLAPCRLGWRTVRVRRPGTEHHDIPGEGKGQGADYCCQDLLEAWNWLASL